MKKPSNRYLYPLLFFCLILGIACQKNVQPKPYGFLALEYPAPDYTNYSAACKYTFDLNDWTTVKNIKNCDLEIHYPQMKATVFVNYRPVEDNLNLLLKDAQKLTYEHFIKADGILEQPYINPNKKVYGMFYEVAGDAATNVQFYATDSVKNFLVASLYFYAKPNFDSILPAANYIKEDMRQMMESLRWEE